MDNTIHYEKCFRNSIQEYEPWLHGQISFAVQSVVCVWNLSRAIIGVTQSWLRAVSVLLHLANEPSSRYYVDNHTVSRS
jgi:hypothetical protein